jgi:Flp pilus assembly protein TadG
MARVIALVRRAASSDSGAELVEMALAFPLLFVLVAAIVDFGLLFQQYEVITNAAREGARVAVRYPYSTADAEARVDSYITQSFMTDPTGYTKDVGDLTPVNVGGNCMNTVTVTVTYPHQYLFLSGIASYFGSTFGTQTLTAASTMRTEVAESTCP